MALVSPSPPRCVVAFDFGLGTIGVAVGQTVTGTASPATSVTARRGEPDWPKLMGVVAQWRPDLLLVGLPLNMDDSESAMAALARGFATQLAVRTGLTVLLVDERLSSFEAKQRLQSDRRHPQHHGVSAQIIAETYLAEPGREWPIAARVAE